MTNAMTHLTLNFLGPAQIKIDDATATGFDYVKIQALLAYLALEAKRPHRREAVAELFWPGKPERAARNSLRQALSKLRQAILDREAEPPFLLISRETVQFNGESAYALDVESFTAVLHTIKRHPHKQLTACKTCIKQLEQAVSLYRGDFLSGLSLKDSAGFEEWLIIKREELRLKAMEAYQNLVAYYENREAYEYALQFARRQVALDTWQEEAHRQLMRLLALNGQRNAALSQYETCRQILAQELNVEPNPDTIALYEQIRAGLALTGPPAEPAAPFTNLPESRTPFIGRQTEQNEIVQRLADDPACRLLTLAGPGGIGKTRLALEAARQILANRKAEFPHGVYFIPMTDVKSPEQIAAKVAAVLQFSFAGKNAPKALLLDYLHAKEALLVMDNFEHLVEDAGFLEELLANAPDVKILVTSRERLNLYEEWLFPVSGLRYPHDLAATNAAEYDAVQLFTQSARRVQAQFNLTEDIQPTVIRICQILEGMPLGIELAATWTHMLSCAEIAREIEHGLDLLRTSWRNFPKQHRSLRVVFDHSWNTLDEDEKQRLRQLSLFCGGFDREAAAQVAQTDLLMLSALVNKSFLRCEPDGRYQMHPLLQRYAATKLAEYPQEKESAARRHAAYYANFMFRQKQALQSSRLPTALTEIKTEIDNVQQGWAQAVQGDKLNELEQYLEGLFLFLEIEGRFQEGITMLEEAVAQLETAAATNPANRQKREQMIGMLLNTQSLFYFRLSQYQRAKKLLQKSLALSSRNGGSPKVQAAGLQVLGHVAYGLGDYTEAEQRYRQSITLFRQIGDRWGEAKLLSSLGVINRLQGQYSAAQKNLRQSLSIYREIGDPRGTAVALNNLGTTLRALGNYAEARQCYQESFAQRKAINDQNGIALTLNNLGNIAAVLEELTTARYLYEESLTICRQLGDRMGTARALNNLGILAHTGGRYAEADRYHLDSVSIKRAIGDRGGMVHSYHHLGRAAMMLGNNQQAWLYFRQALEIASEMKSAPLTLMSLVGAVPLLEQKASPEFVLEMLAVILQRPALSRQIREEAQESYARVAVKLDENQITAVQKQAKKKKLADITQAAFDLDISWHNTSIQPLSLQSAPRCKRGLIQKQHHNDGPVRKAKSL